MRERIARLQKRTLGLFGDLGHKDGPDGLLEYLVQAFLRERRAFHVRVGFYLLGQLGALFASNGRQVLLLKRLNCVGVVAQVDLGACEEENHEDKQTATLTLNDLDPWTKGALFWSQRTSPTKLSGMTLTEIAWIGLLPPRIRTVGVKVTWGQGYLKRLEQARF